MAIVERPETNKDKDTKLKLEELIVKGYVTREVKVAEGFFYTLKTLTVEELTYSYALVERKIKELGSESPYVALFNSLQTVSYLTMSIIKTNGTPITIQVPLNTPSGEVKTRPVILPVDLLNSDEFTNVPGMLIDTLERKFKMVSKLSSHVLSRLSDEYNKLTEDAGKLLSGVEIKN